MSEYIHAIDLRKGQTIIWKNELYLVLDHSFNKTAMRGGIVKCKVKNLKTSTITIEDFSGQKFEKASMNKINVIYSYADNDFLHFVEEETFDDISVAVSNFPEVTKYLEEGCSLSLTMYEKQVINVNLPDVVTLTIEDISDDLPSTDEKKVITTTGLVVAVPKFCEVGQQILVSSVDGKYKSR